MRRDSRAPLIVAIVLLLLPVLYLGSYGALVVPGGCEHHTAVPGGPGYFIETHYRIPGRAIETLFWPLEQVHRTVRPRSWASL